MDREVRGLVDLYAQAQEHAKDPERRMAYLEKCALLWEDVIGDPRRASRAFEEILVLDPDRRVAILGLARTAARTGDGKAHARALLRRGSGGRILVSAFAFARPMPATRGSLSCSRRRRGARDRSRTPLRARSDSPTRGSRSLGRAAESIRARIDRASTSSKIAHWLPAQSSTSASTSQEALDSLAPPAPKSGIPFPRKKSHASFSR